MNEEEYVNAEELVPTDKLDVITVNTIREFAGLPYMVDADIEITKSELDSIMGCWDDETKERWNNEHN